MSTSLKISANTSEVKKSLLDLSKDVKNLGKTKISVFSESDRKFIKEEMNREIATMKNKLAENRAEIAKLVQEQQKMEKGTKDELETRKKILEAYRVQTRLANQLNQNEKTAKGLGGFGGAGGSIGGSISGIAGMLAKVGSLLGMGALFVGGLALVRGFQANEQFKSGASNRVRLRGLGMESLNVGSPEELANAGMTEQDFIKRQSQLVSRLGRTGGARESVMGQARFERAFGLDEGTMGGIATSLRGQFGGQGANEAQMRLQASVFAAGIEDALAPYLESATQLLADINKNGVTNTDEIIGVMAELVKNGERTPEQIAEAFSSVDAAIKGSSGEANAFFQTAFARGGIGGGTIGGTRMAMSSGGLFGLSKEELLKRGYNPDLIQNMEGAGFTKGLGGRTDAVLNQFKASAGLGAKQRLSSVQDINTMVGLSQMANSTFGTQGTQGFDALLMLEKVQNKQMSQKQFDKKLEEMKAGKDPTIERLSKINSTLEAQTEILTNINTNLMENLGKKAVKVGNIATQADSAVIQGTGNVAGAVENTGILDMGMKAMRAIKNYTVGGELGGKIYDWLHPEENQNENYLDQYRTSGIPDFSKAGNIPDSLPASSPASGTPATSEESMANAVEAGVTRAFQNQKTPVIRNNNVVNVRSISSDGRITDKTHR